MKNFTTIIMLTACMIATVQAQKIKEVEGFKNPESVVTHKKHLFVSNLGEQLDPTAKDGDGFISMLSRIDGKMMEQKFITGLNSPKGMFVKFGILHIADADKIVAYSIKTQKKLWEADLSKVGITYANDIAMGCFKLYVSSTDKDAIYKVKLSGKITKLEVKGELPGANGLYKCGSSLYVANYGRANELNGSFGKISLCNKKYTSYKTGGAYDGIIKRKGSLIITDWVSLDENKGRLITYKHSNNTLYNIELDRPLNGPADLMYDKKSKGVWIPAMRENKLLFVSWSLLK